MDKIELHAVLPEVFAGRDGIESDVWHKETSFQRGRKCLVQAASGTGKSSLCSFIYGYRKDYQGIICFDGENIRKYPMKRWVELRQHHLGMLFQELRLFGELTAYENIRLKNSLTGYCKRKQIEEWLERLGIADKRDARTDHLSYGQQQRVAFIRALCQPLDFLFLDEPISHLDDENARIMGQIIDEEMAQRGMGVIVTSIGKHIELNYDVTMNL